MAVVHTPDSAYAKEQCRWNAHHTEFGPPGRPYVFADYPMRMYRAVRKPDGSRVLDPGETANDADERVRLEARGFVSGGPKAAFDALEKFERECATLAAERNFEVRRMSEGARREVEATEEAAGAKHLPTIPERHVPAHHKRKRGRPRKTAAAPAPPTALVETPES